MIKLVGWIITCIGGIVTFVNGKTYILTSSEIQAWYHYRTELETARTFLFFGAGILVIGIAILLTAYLKNNKS